MGYSSELTALDKDILDVLSDGYYFVSIIASLLTKDVKEGPNEYQVLERLAALHSGNFIFLLINKTFDRIRIAEEFQGKADTKAYWFGRTEKGYKAWLEYAEEWQKEAEQSRSAKPLHASRSEAS